MTVRRGPAPHYGPAVNRLVAASPFPGYSTSQLQLSGGVPMAGYCLKCRTSREIQSPQAVTLKNGSPATQGVCPTCGTKMFRIGKVE